ncbi:two-component system response regulator TorR [Escherichia coli]
MPHHIVIVEDEPVTQARLQSYFTQEGYTVSVTASGAGLREIMQNQPVDLILLDINLPDENGLMLTRALRERSTVGIILVTGRSDRIDRIVGLEMGADDYVTKPLELRELVVRVKNLLWRIDLARQAQPHTQDNCYRFAGYCLNVSRHTLERDGEPIKLTRAEYEMLVAFVTNPGEILSRERLLRMLSARRVENPDLRTVDVLIRRLRHKLSADLLVIELVNAIDAPQVKSRVGVPWFQMGYQPGRYLVQWAHGKPLNVLLMPGPDNAGGSKEMVEGFRAAIAGSPVRIVDIALGDNDIEIQRNLLQEMLERHPEIDVVAGTAIAAEAAMGEGRNLKTPLTVVSFYLSHQVYRGLKRGRVIMAASDQMVWQGELAVEQAIRQLQGQSVSDNVSPPILVLTPKNADREHIRRSLSPGGFRPVYFYQHTSAAKK